MGKTFGFVAYIFDIRKLFRDLFLHKMSQTLVSTPWDYTVHGPARRDQYPLDLKTPLLVSV